MADRYSSTNYSYTFERQDTSQPARTLTVPRSLTRYFRVQKQEPDGEEVFSAPLGCFRTTIGPFPEPLHGTLAMFSMAQDYLKTATLTQAVYVVGYPGNEVPRSAQPFGWGMRQRGHTCGVSRPYESRQTQ